MIFSFSVPDNERNTRLIHWYRNIDPQERSRRFREIFLSYLDEGRHNNEVSTKRHISHSATPIKLAMIDIGSDNSEIDLDSRLDSIGILGGGFE